MLEDQLVQCSRDVEIWEVGRDLPHRAEEGASLYQMSNNTYKLEN